MISLEGGKPMKKEIETIITKMLIRIAVKDWNIGSNYVTYEEWAKGKKGYIQYATRKIIELTGKK